MSFFTRLKGPIFKNTGSTARDHLASERTYLAWLRTGLGFIALGIAVERFSQLDLESILDEIRPDNATRSRPEASRREREAQKAREQALVGALLGTGTGSIVYGVTRYFSTMRLLEAGQFKPSYYGAGGLGVAVAGMAGAAYWSTVRREGERHGHR